jgi:hypothetical protein
MYRLHIGGVVVAELGHRMPGFQAFRVDWSPLLPEALVTTERGLDKWLELNREYAQKWPNITVKKDMPKDARALLPEGMRQRADEAGGDQRHRPGVIWCRNP